MNKIIIGLVAISSAAALAGAGWYYRPWSEYSPAEIQAAIDPERLPETFRNMGEIFPYRTIEPVESARPLPRADATQNVAYSFNGADLHVDDWLEASRSTGLMVLHNGRVVHEQYLLGSTPETRHTSRSARALSRP